MIMEENIKMDSNIKWVNEVKINRTLEALRKNNMESFLINTHEELINKIKEMGSSHLFFYASALPKLSNLLIKSLKSNRPLK